MEALIRLAKRNRENDILEQICNIEKLTPHEFLTTITNNNPDHIIVEMFNTFIDRDDFVSKSNLKNIKFEIFNVHVRQYCLCRMIEKNYPIDHLCILLDKMNSINFGTTLTGNNLNPLLHYAWKNNHSMIKLLIEKYNADINHRSDDDETAILICAREGHIQLMWYLYGKGAKIHTTTRHITDYPSKNVSDLITIWQENNYHFYEKELPKVESLVAYFSDPTKRRLHSDLTRLDDATLLKACISETNLFQLFHTLVVNRSDLSLEYLQLIDFDKLNVDTRQYYLSAMLQTNHSIESILFFLDRVNTVNYGSSHEYSINPLIYCCYTNKYDLVKLLVEKYNANIDYPSQKNTTAIMYSAQQGNIEITKYLYDKGAKLQIFDKYIYTYATKEIKKLICSWELKSNPIKAPQIFKKIDPIVSNSLDNSKEIVEQTLQQKCNELQSKIDMLNRQLCEIIDLSNKGDVKK